MAGDARFFSLVTLILVGLTMVNIMETVWNWVLVEKSLSKDTIKMGLEKKITVKKRKEMGNILKQIKP